MDVPPIQPPPFSPPPQVAPQRPQYHAPPGAPAAAPRKSGNGWLWALGIVGVVVLGVVGLFAVMLSSLGAAAGGSGTHGASGGKELHEVVLEDNDSRNKIAVLSVEGVITGSPIDADGRSLVDLIKHQLERAAEDDAVKAVVLRVDSPGGEVLASDEIYILLWEFMEAHKDKPIVVSMGSLAASGGYYVSAPCQWIVANELTMTGSIGVIFHGYNYRALMDKVGVRPSITKSGKLKDMMSGEKTAEEELPEERQIMQSMIDESFGRFKQVIREGRKRAADRNQGEGKTLAANWESIADGRILSGRAALEQGLVDELGNFQTAVGRARKLADVEDANLVSFDPPISFGSLFRMFGKAQSEANTVRLDLGMGIQSKLPQGRLYFLSPLHAH
jgi:protease-4